MESVKRIVQSIPGVASKTGHRVTHLCENRLRSDHRVNLVHVLCSRGLCACSVCVMWAVSTADPAPNEQSDDAPEKLQGQRTASEKTRV